MRGSERDDSIDDVHVTQAARSEPKGLRDIHRDSDLIALPDPHLDHATTLSDFCLLV